MDKELGKKVAASFFVSSLLSLTLFLFAPAHIYFTNIFEHSSSFIEVLPFLLVPLLLLILLLTLFLGLLKSSIHNKALSVLFMIAVLLWLQGNILVWDYGLLDGTGIDWSKKWHYGLVDTTIWIILMITGFMASKTISRIAQNGSIALIMIQLASILIVAGKAPDVSQFRNKPLSDEQSIFSFSPERNVILLVLDSFRGDIFWEIIEEDSHYKEFFDGFTCYRDTLGGYQATFAAVPLILTGRFYENREPIRSFIKDVFSTDSIPKLLKSNGYQVDLIDGRGIYADETIASSRVRLKHLVEQDFVLKEAAYLCDIALFRCLPHFTKKIIYNDQDWRISNLGLDTAMGGFPAGFHRDAIEFTEKMARTAKPDNPRRTFKYIHLMVPHPPIKMNERMEFAPMELNRANLKTQSKGALELANIFLKKLKEMGIYDDSMIFVMADHGHSRMIENELNDRSFADIDGFPPLQSIRGEACPILLVKPFGATGSLKISNAPVSLADVAKTIARELKLEAQKFPGISVFEINESDQRDRRFLYHKWEGYKEVFYLPPMREFIVSGPIWLDDSWRLSGRIYAPERNKPTSP